MGTGTHWGRKERTEGSTVGEAERMGKLWEKKIRSCPKKVQVVGELEDTDFFNL